MNIEQQMEVFSDILKDENILAVKGINETNHKPHQFNVGPKHSKEANDINGGVITEDILEKHKCALPGCHLKYSQHETDKLLFLQLTRDAFENDVHEELVKIKSSLKELDIKGVAFVDTEEQFKFIKYGDSSDTKFEGESQREAK